MADLAATRQAGQQAELLRIGPTAYYGPASFGQRHAPRLQRFLGAMRPIQNFSEGMRHANLESLERR